MATLRTFAVAVAGTTLSIAAALPLGVLATRSLWQEGALAAGEPEGAARVARSALCAAARGLLGFLRAVPELMWALLFVVAVGLGPLPGALALGVAYTGVLGRVYADVFDAVEPGPVAAIHALGATRTQVFLAAVWPQARPSILAYTLYSFECCMRAAAVLGFVGAGGVGSELALSMRMFEYGQVLTLLGAFAALVGCTDALSRWTRRRHVSAPRGVGRRIVHVGLAALVIASFVGSGFFDVDVDAATPRHVLRFAAQLVPDVSPAFLRTLAEPLAQTVAISLMGTLLGVVIGGALAPLAAANVALARKDEPGLRAVRRRVARAAAFAAARATLGALRAIPELVWVLVCILAVGLGPFAGTLAVGLHTGGVLGKLYAESLEEVPAGPVEAMRGAGATALHRLAWGILPLARPMLASYTLLRWETNLRASTVVGLVGGGGLGLLFYNDMQLAFYDRVATLLLLIYALVVATDALGGYVRARMLGLPPRRSARPRRVRP